MRLIDISHCLDGNTPVYPGDFDTSLVNYKSLEINFYNAYLLHSCLHTGTHIDMPMHMLNDERRAADFDIACFVGAGVLIDARGQDIVYLTPEYETMIAEGSVVLFYTGFDEYYFNPVYFTRYPIIDKSFADFLVKRRVKMIGTDTAAPDYPPFDIHKLLLANDVFILENLTNLKALAGIGRFEVMAFPLKINAEASFVRAVCRVY